MNHHPRFEPSCPAKRPARLEAASLAFSVGLALFGASLPAAAQSASDDMKGRALVTALQAGGHILYMRHTATEKDYADQVAAVMGDCSTQRMLSESGWRDARRIGRALETLRAPVAEVYASQYCRAWQTADLAFGRHVKLEQLNFEPSEAYSAEQIAAMRGRVSDLLKKTPAKGYNVVYVGHDDPFEAATGIYPEPQGVVYVVHPDGANGFEIVGSIAPDAWSRLIDLTD